MKRSLYIAILFLIIGTFQTQAQIPDYYTDKKIIRGEDYTYTVTPRLLSNDTLGYNIENISNIYFHKEMKEIKKKNLSPFRPNEYGINFKDRVIVFKAFTEVFTKEEIDSFIDPKEYSGISVSFVCDSIGKTLEVMYLLGNDGIELSIPPNRLYQLERLLKERVEFEPWPHYKGLFEFAKGMSISVNFRELRAMYPDKDYYTGKKIIQGEGYTYTVTPRPRLNNAIGYTIENSSNTYFHKEMKEEREVNFRDKSIVFNAFKEIFTRGEISVLIAPSLYNQEKYNGITISFVCDSAGKTLEVRYSLDINYPTHPSISPDKLYQLELLLKERVVFEPGTTCNGTFEFAKGMFIYVDFRRLIVMYPYPLPHET